MRSTFPPAILIVVLLIAACGQAAPGLVEPAAPAAATPGAGPVTPSRLSPEEVIARVASQYPERFTKDVSLEQRMADMAFLRDRIIETGICGGLNLAWNRKQNGARSIDAINWRHGEADVNDVVDLAPGYDDLDRPLTLQWHIVQGPAGWDPYPPPTCGAG